MLAHLALVYATSPDAVAQDTGSPFASAAERRGEDVEELDRPPRVALTASERTWIDEHPVIRVGVDPEFHPFEFIDEDGVHRGMAADYLALLGPRLGLEFEVVPGLTWNQVVERAEAGEIDLLPSVGRTREREGYLTYSEPYAEYHRVIVTRTDMPFLRGLSDLEGLRVAVQTNSSHEGFVHERSALDPIGCPTLEECTRAVSSGEIDALIGNIASLAHWIRRLNLTNLKVAGAASDEVHTLHIATRADWPVLAGIIQKGLASITDAERDAITERWVVLQYEPEIDRRSMWRVVLVSAIVVVLLAVWALFMRRQQSRLQRARDAALAAEAEARQANRELEQMRRDLEELVARRTAELMESERRFHEAQKMEALGTLVGGIAHDFNNLLQGMLGAIFLVEEDLEDPTHKRYLTDAAKLGTHGADLIRQLLAVARKGGGGKEPVDLHELLDELAPVLRTTLPPTIAFERNEEDRELFVFGNATLLQQVVLNLIHNARDAVLGRDRARVCLTLRSRRPDEPLPDALTDGPYAVLEVADNGPGIGEDVLERIYDPFFTTKPKGKGTGLGLAMAFGAVEGHGGLIDVDTDPERGTTFVVYLPLVDPHRAASASGPSELVFGRGETILIADDQPTVLESHAVILTRIGYRVLTAPNGEEALAVLDREAADVDLVILDVLMPDLDGVSAARRIRERWPRMPIIFLSAYDPEGDLPASLRPEGEFALTKPCTPYMLSHEVRRALDGTSVQVDVEQEE